MNIAVSTEFCWKPIYLLWFQFPKKPKFTRHTSRKNFITEQIFNI